MSKGYNFWEGERETTMISRVKIVLTCQRDHLPCLALLVTLVLL